MTDHQKRLLQILISFTIFIVALLLQTEKTYLTLCLYFTSYVIIGGEIIVRACRHILQGQLFDENFLMALATIGAFAIGQYPEGVAVMLFYQIGELFQSYAIHKSRRSISDLMDIRPDYANLRKNNEIIRMDPENVHIGDIIIIKSGEKIPLDAQIIEGNSMLDTSALTGESLPKEVGFGDMIISGCINLCGVLVAKVTKEFEESTVSKILNLVENASSKKSKSENFITKFARYYTPAVVIFALFLAFVPPLCFQFGTLSSWVYRALTFLVISCPCALVISVPLSFFGGIGAASRKGILVKGSNYLEVLAETEIVVFDKTGTLTKGVFCVQKIHNEDWIEAEELLKYAAYAENFSNHPISTSLKEAYGKEIDHSIINNIEEISGLGITATIKDKKVFAGNAKLMEKLNISYNKQAMIGTTVFVAIDGKYAGAILIADEIKEDSKKTIDELKKNKIKNIVMLTGDGKKTGESVGKALGIDEVYTELLPIDKVSKVEELMRKKTKKGKLAFVGDGVNDAPVLARSDVGIAMGGLGSDAAIEAADIVMMTDEPSKIITAMHIARRTLAIAKQNIIFALSIKLIVLTLGAFGYSTMWFAVFADVGVSVLAILNASRALRIKHLK